ncbi:MAG: hypothetical protein ACOVLB_04800 [Candidatus Nanopelagicus sp.]
MDNRKFEQLIDLIINENEDQARALFHDIVVEKSREIYESMMDESEYEMSEGDIGGQVGGLLDEIGAEEEGMTEEDDEFADIEVSDEEGDDGFGDEGEEQYGDEEFGDEEDLEDRVTDLEDKLDELMAEFEEQMGGDEDMGGEEDFGDEEDEEDYADQEEEESLEESVQLQAVKGLYGSKIGGDDGSNSKSVALNKPKVVATGAKPVNFSGESSTGGTQGGLLKPNPNTIPGSYKNAPGSKGAKTEAAPKAHTAQATGTNVKSPVAEGRTAKKRLK